MKIFTLPLTFIRRSFNAVGLTLIIAFTFSSTFAQQGEWTWMRGDSTGGSSGHYGIQGVADTLNEPGSTDECVSWVDQQGNLWLFGGEDTYGDLWKYDVVANKWTWMKGPGTQFQSGVYGSQGIPSASNFPGGRSRSASWIDSSGHLWLYGGIGVDAFGGYAYMDDLWMYDILSNEWTWMKGSDTTGVAPVYGTYQVEDIANTPGARGETNATWRDVSNNLWIYGGAEFPYPNNLSDMWRYNTSTNNWAWMQGSNLPQQLPDWGTLGVPSSNNTPGGRMAYAKWTDQDGNFWLFGALEYVISLGGKLNDLWKYDVATNEWTWISGANYEFASGLYGTKCEPSVSHVPDARMRSRIDYVDANGNFWLFGGSHIYAYMGMHNDLWIFKPNTNEWTWISGDTILDPPGHWGTAGVSSPLNKPSGREGFVSWKDVSGNLWVFGGTENFVLNYKNDLWRFIPDPACQGNIQTVAFSSSQDSICEKFCTNFFDQSVNNPTAWQWQFPGGNPSSSALQNPANICYNLPGSYDVTLITTNASGNDTLTHLNSITVIATPAIPSITQAGYTLTSSAAFAYQWQFNSVDIPGATNQSYTISQTGFYSVVVSNQQGCVSSSTLLYVLISGVGEVFSNENISIENLSSGIFNLAIANAEPGELNIRVYNCLGQLVFKDEEMISNTSFKKEINLTTQPPGIYFLKVNQGAEECKMKIVKLSFY